MRKDEADHWIDAVNALCPLVKASLKQRAANKALNPIVALAGHSGLALC